MEYKNLPLFEWFLGDEEDGINALSLVDAPAIKKDWVALKEDKDIVRFATVDNDKHILVALLLIPEMPIYRKFGEDEMYVFFSTDTVQQISEDYLKKGNQKAVTAMHGKLMSGVTLVQSWLVEDPKMDKINLYKMEAPVGSWAGVLKVDNMELWEDYIKTGVLKGVSVEGIMSSRDGDNFGSDLSDEVTLKEMKTLLQL